MKKIFTILAFIGFVSSAAAQRHADIAITGISFPTNKSTIKSDNNFPIAFTVKNNGPDLVKMADSIAIYFGSNRVTDTSSLRMEIYMTVIPPDSAITLLDGAGNALLMSSMHWAGYANDSFKSFCVTARFHSAAIDPVVDPTFANNTNCADSVYMLDVQNYLSEDKVKVSVFPNPAASSANFNLELRYDATVTIKLFDLLGRNVLGIEKGKLSGGNHTIPISTDGLQNGVYLYQVLTDKDKQTGTISIVK